MDSLAFTGIHRWKRIAAIKKKLPIVFNKYLEQYTVSAILYSGGSGGLTSFVLDFCRKNKIKTIYNLVEWYNYSNFEGRFKSVNYIKYLYDFHFLYPKINNIIAISTMLADFSRKKKCNTIRIPTIVDTTQYPLRESGLNSEKVSLVYAGKIAKKDDMMNVIKAIALLRPHEKEKILFTMYGISEEELLRDYSLDLECKALIGKQVLCKGIIPYYAVRDYLVQADFTILLRRQWRNANAGFPTKIGESMAAGVPVIANITSDIGLYLHDGIEGIVCDDNTPSACAAAIRKALLLSSDEKKAMRLNARKRAEQSFDFRSYVNAMSDFIHNLI
jgi:glycosyltransferase involved in cell wall biosynthesis